jgi:DNA-binding NtrC family response regulator
VTFDKKFNFSKTNDCSTLLEKSLKKKILVIDDNENVRHLLNLELSDLGYKVVTVCDASNGLDILKEKGFSLIILDINTARIDSIEALEKIFYLPKDLPVIIHSAYSHFKEDYPSWKAMDYVLKSGDMKPLLKTIERNINLTVKRNENKKLGQ